MHFIILVARRRCSLSPVWTCVFIVAKGLRRLESGLHLWELHFCLFVCDYVSRWMTAGVKRPATIVLHDRNLSGKTFGKKHDFLRPLLLPLPFPLLIIHCLLTCATSLMIAQRLSFYHASFTQSSLGEGGTKENWSKWAKFSIHYKQVGRLQKRHKIQKQKNKRKVCTAKW